MELKKRGGGSRSMPIIWKPTNDYGSGYFHVGGPPMLASNFDGGSFLLTVGNGGALQRSINQDRDKYLSDFEFDVSLLERGVNAIIECSSTLVASKFPWRVELKEKEVAYLTV